MKKALGLRRTLLWIILFLPFICSVPLVHAEWANVNPPTVSSNWELLGVRGFWAVGQDLAGQQGVLLHFSNGSWATVQVPAVSADWGLAAIDFGSAYEGLAVGQDYTNSRGAVLRYENGTWTSFEPSVDISSDWGLSAVDSLSSTGGWVAGQDFANKRGVLLHYETVVVTPPVVSTTAVSEITTTGATSGGTVASDGGAPVTARGVCWGTSGNPTVGGSCTTDGTGTGAFTSSIGGLTPSTRYHVRAYATNSVGTGYGSDVTFTTLSTSVLPVVTTDPVTIVNSTTVSTGGNVTSEGITPVTARGVCWDVSPLPTVALPTCTNNGTGLGTFTSLITGLTPSATYHVRAYATNSLGTGYGRDIPFITPASDVAIQTMETILIETDTTAPVTRLVLTPATLPDVSTDWGLTGVRLSWAVGNDNENKRGVLLHYVNGSWISVVPPDVSSDWGLSSVDAVSSNEAWAVGQDNVNNQGVLLHFVNGAWTSVEPPDVSSDWGLSAIVLISSGEGWAAGTDNENKKGVLLQYINGSWVPVALPDVSADWGLSAVDLFSFNQGWAVGKSSDGQNATGVLLQYTVPLISASPVAIDYHEVEPGASSDQTVVVKNVGNGDLVMGTITLPSSPFAIQIDSCSGTSLPPLKTCKVTYRFLPESVGVFDSSSTIPSNGGIVTVTLSGKGGPGPINSISLADPPDGQTYAVCPDLGSSLFQWESSGVFASLEVLFSLAPDFANVPVKVRGNPAVNQVTLPTSTWKKVLLLPGTDGGAVYWTVIGKKNDKTSVEGDVFSLDVAGAQPVADPGMSHTSKTTQPPPTLSWENQCNTKFKAWFGNSADLQAGSGKRVAISFTIQDPNANQGVFTKTLTSSQWSSIRRLVGYVTGAVLYWYVESWDALGRQKKTDVMSFVLTY